MSSQRPWETRGAYMMGPMGGPRGATVKRSLRGSHRQMFQGNVKVRPMGFEYRTAEDKVCQLWRHRNECPGSLIEPATVNDCFRRTTSRLHQLEYEVREL